MAQLLRHKPVLSYSGMTIIMSNPSRFDKLHLLTANGGDFFNNKCLRPDINLMMCDVRLSEDQSPFLPNTKCILLLGEHAMHSWVSDSRNNTLNELRGSPLYVEKDGLKFPAIASYFPQDTVDFKNYESQFNTNSHEYSGADDDISEDGQDEEGSEKTLGRTKKSNYCFWLQKDVEKCKDILQSNHIPKPGMVSRIFTVLDRPTYHIYPRPDLVVKELESHTNCWMDFDIETDYEKQNLLCFAFSFDGGHNVYSVPVLDYTYSWAYADLPRIIRALQKAVRNNILVAHNGAGFDFFVLAVKYSIVINKAYDTMLSQHRCYPDIEKSLGHCISLWTWERFHKDTDSRAYLTKEHMMDKLSYCAKDVYGMSLVRQAIQRNEKTIPGLSDSIQCAQDSIKSYLTMCIQGLRYDQEMLEKIKRDNDKLMNHYMRVIVCLIGKEGIEECKRAIKGGKAKLLPLSNKQCVEYFHNILGYPVVMRSKKTGEPSLGKVNMYKLALKHENPVITFILLFRQTQKEFSSLKFVPWRDNNNQIIDYDNYIEKQNNPCQGMFNLATDRLTQTSSNGIVSM